jgi:hypothetical protein
MFGYDYTLASLSDIHALDTINWRWVTDFSAAGYPLLSNGTNNANGTTISSSNGLSSGAIAGIAVGVVAVVVSQY